MQKIFSKVNCKKEYSYFLLKISHQRQKTIRAHFLLGYIKNDPFLLPSLLFVLLNLSNFESKWAYTQIISFHQLVACSLESIQVLNFWLDIQLRVKFWPLLHLHWSKLNHIFFLWPKYQLSQQKLGQFLEHKVCPLKIKVSKNVSITSCSPSWTYSPISFKENHFHRDLTDFQC